MTQYCGIIISDTDLYVSVVKRTQNIIKVLDRYVCKRGQSLISDLADVHRKNKHISTLYSLAYTEIPQLMFKKIYSNTPLQDAWKEKEALMTRQDNQYTYQFILPTIDSQEWLYMVGVLKSRITELQRAKTKNDMEIEVVANNNYKIKINNEEQAHKLLKELIDNNIVVNKFEIQKPTLNDIFIEKVGE